MIRRPPRATRTDTLCPYTTLFRSEQQADQHPHRRLPAVRDGGFRPDPLRPRRLRPGRVERSEEHKSELQSLMRNSYAVFCLKKKKHKRQKCNAHLTKIIDHENSTRTTFTHSITRHSVRAE